MLIGCRMGIGVGTPARIMGLLDAGTLLSLLMVHCVFLSLDSLIYVGALSSSKLERVLVYVFSEREFPFPDHSWSLETCLRSVRSADKSQDSQIRLEQAILTPKSLSSDCSHIDQKKRGILDMRETQQPLMLLLNRHELKKCYGVSSGGEVQLILY